MTGPRAAPGPPFHVVEAMAVLVGDGFCFLLELHLSVLAVSDSQLEIVDDVLEFGEIWSFGQFLRQCGSE